MVIEEGIAPTILLQECNVICSGLSTSACVHANCTGPVGHKIIVVNFTNFCMFIAILIFLVVAKAQQMVGCNDEGACTGNQVITTKELCCNIQSGAIWCCVCDGWSEGLLSLPSW